MRQLLLIIGLLTLRTTAAHSNDYEDAERWYFMHRVNSFDVNQTTTESLCSISIQERTPRWETSEVYQPYIQEAKRRGLNEKQCAKLTGRFNKPEK